MYTFNKEITEIIRQMLLEESIPREGLFDISETILNRYNELYGNRHNIINGRHDKNFARKLAGLTFVKIKFNRGATPVTCKEGFVYAISNPAWPDHIKIGMTLDVHKRLASYQMYDPFKKYKIEAYEFSLNRRKTEEDVLNTFGIHIENGEWLRNTEANTVIQCIRTGIWVL